MSGPLAVLDLGETLVAGPDRGPATRILAGLTDDRGTRRRLHRALMTTDAPDPATCAALVAGPAGVPVAALEGPLTEVWRAQESEPRRLPGVPAVLHALLDAGFALAVLSNIWPPYLTGVRAVLGTFLDAHVPPELQLYSCREGRVKPDDVLFRRVLDRAGRAPSEAVMVGDSRDKDVEPALALGMGAVWLADPVPERGDGVGRVVADGGAAAERVAHLWTSVGSHL